MANYYQILGVKIVASQAEIKSAYRKKAKEYHPDMPNGAKAKFQEVDEAYKTIRDPQKRKIYDLKNGFKRKIKKPSDFVWEEFSRAWESYEEPTDFGRESTPPPPKNPCPECNGLGRTCWYCKGSGKAPAPVDLPWGRIHCIKCNGYGEKIKDFHSSERYYHSMNHHWSRCSHCSGSGLEPIPVSVPNGRRYCTKCDGFGEIEKLLSLDDSFWSRCSFCSGTGLYPIPVEIPPNRKKCRKCNGYREIWRSSSEFWSRCSFCNATGLDPIPVKIPPGRKRCRDCNGYGERWNSSSEFWSRCSNCRGSGLDPVYNQCFI